MLNWVLGDDGYDEIWLRNCYKSKTDVKFLSLLKSSVIKAVYCVNCGACEAECKFSTYAAFWIGQTIRRAIEDKSDAIRKPASAHSRARLVHKIEAETNSSLSVTEIADMAGLTEEEVVFIRQLDQQKIMSMDAGFFDDDEDDQSYHETIASPANIEEETNKKIQHEMLAGLIKMIPDPDTRDIMLMHLGMNKSESVFSNRTIAVIKNKFEVYLAAITYRLTLI